MRPWLGASRHRRGSGRCHCWAQPWGCISTDLSGFFPIFPPPLFFIFNANFFFSQEDDVTSAEPRYGAAFGVQPQSQELKQLGQDLLKSICFPVRMHHSFRKRNTALKTIPGPPWRPSLPSGRCLCSYLTGREPFLHRKLSPRVPAQRGAGVTWRWNKPLAGTGTISMLQRSTGFCPPPSAACGTSCFLQVLNKCKRALVFFAPLLL